MTCILFFICLVSNAGAGAVTAAVLSAFGEPSAGAVALLNIKNTTAPIAMTNTPMITAICRFIYGV